MFNFLRKHITTPIVRKTETETPQKQSGINYAQIWLDQMARMKFQHECDDRRKSEQAAQLANPETMPPSHPDYMRMVVHSMD